MWDNYIYNHNDKDFNGEVLFIDTFESSVQALCESLRLEPLVAATFISVGRKLDQEEHNDDNNGNNE